MDPSMRDRCLGAEAPDSAGETSSANVMRCKLGSRLEAAFRGVGKIPFAAVIGAFIRQCCVIATNPRPDSSRPRLRGRPRNSGKKSGALRAGRLAALPAGADVLAAGADHLLPAGADH